MTESLSVDPEILRADVRDKYRAVATNPHDTFHFHTGRPLTELLGRMPGRVIVGEIRSDGSDQRGVQRLTMHEMHRFFHGDITDEEGGRHWDVEEIWLGIREGLRSAA